MEIIEGNKLIAEFMGMEYKLGVGGFILDNANENYKQFLVIYPQTKWWFSINELRFHTSWDWLIPVVEKIEGLANYGRVVIKSNTAYIPGVFYEKGKEIIFKAETKILAVWLAVVEFIQWYNNETIKK